MMAGAGQPERDVVSGRAEIILDDAEGGLRLPLNGGVTPQEGE